MAIEQEVYNTLNPLSDAQLQEKIQQATSYIEKGFFRDFLLDFCFGLSHLDVTRLNDMYVQSYRNKYVAQKILECRKDSKPYTFFDTVPVPTPAIEEKPVEPETIVREQKYRNNSGINKQQIIDDLKGKTIEESKEYILQWSNMITYNSIQIKLSGFDKRWYDVIFELDDDYYEKWNYYSSYHRDLKNLYNPDIKGMKEKYGKFYYNIILSRIPYNEDIEFLNKLEWTDYKDFLKGKIDIEKNPSAFANRVRYVGYILQDTLMSESDLIEQLEEIMAINKKNPKVPVNLCDRWLERLKSGVKVKEL